jgi:hypothetical protein
VWTAIVAALFFLIGCGNGQEQVAENNEQNEQSSGVDIDEKETTLYTYPLTGLPSNEESTKRAVSVMINNHPQARPQSGITKADMVYEVIAEGGITRLLAVFQSEQPDIVGPVRSARSYYIELAKGLDAIYVHHGHSPDAEQMINQGFIESINGLYYDGTLFKRASFRKAPHNSYITFNNIEKGANEKNYDLTGAPNAYQFLKEDEKVDGTEQPEVTISYSTNPFKVHYEFDGELNAYKRYSGDIQTVDYETDAPVLLNNIFIVEMQHRKIDDYGRLDIDLTSGGEALLLQNGIIQEIEWKNIDGRIVPYLNGSEVSLVPGKTWINVVPDLDEMVQM